MTDEELLEAIAALRSANTEVADVEAKAARSLLPRSLRPTLSAFSNSTGGGVDDPAAAAAELSGRPRQTLN